ncbi:hypothetical protein [Kitasatospora sp. NPDC051914]|uniref:hypothetical protein n=1 Tax=Kitasatospora sp. NPDC051914 TaxID=3154945 RepID=UPI00342135F4
MRQAAVVLGGVEVSRRAGAAVAALAAAAALLLTGCGPHGDGAGKAVQSQQDDGTQQMQQKLDAAESAAAQADTDATQNN